MCVWALGLEGVAISCTLTSSFAGLEKDVLLLSKTTPGQPFSSFMGKGIIPLSPDFVFNSLRNPQLRFMYDNMLKVSR